MPREFVFRNRQCYSAYFMLAVIEMLKYAVKEDYESSRTDIQLLPCQLDYIIPQRKSSKKPRLSTNANSKKKKKQADLKNKQNNQKYEDSSEDSEEFKEEEDEADSKIKSVIGDDMMDEPGSYFIKFKEGIPGLVRKDMMVDDLWILLKRPVVTNQSLADVTDAIFGRAAWHFNSKQTKMKI